MSEIKLSVNKDDPLSNIDQKGIIDQIISNNKDLPGATMVILNEIQNQIGFISESMQTYIGKELNVPVSTVHGVVSFYSFFTTSPRGKHTVKFCMGTACYVGGIPQLLDKAKQILEIEPGETTPDGEITLETCRCVGACSQAPVITIDEEIIGKVDSKKLSKLLRQLKQVA
ncbi:MAG: NAD(P)H-dependent oxidoreductase subunit E [Anaerolineaceae bacterium]|nr:NAD(P)H-dependent oxidoreductase subunit E [Anaerolineaceae bacterium]